MLDVLVALHELRLGSGTELLTGQLENPLDELDWPRYYHDQNGDARLTTLDALRKRNVLALIQGAEAERESTLMRFGPPQPSNDLPENGTQVSSGCRDLASGKITIFKVAVFGDVSGAFEPRTVAPDSNGARGPRGLQAIDIVFMSLLQKIS